MTVPQLRRLRWAVRATLMLGVAVSVIANVLHAVDNPISQAIAAWPPLALLLTVELISRVPVHRRGLAVTRMLATATIAGIAAWVSYWHMSGVAARYGESGSSPYLIPLTVDGLIVVGSICLVELNGRITDANESTATAAPVPAPTPARGPVFDHRLPIGPEPAPVDKLSTPKAPRKRPPTVAPRVIAAHKRTPDASDEQLAKRVGVSKKTVQRHRPPKAEPEQPINGNKPVLEKTPA
jgi:hypothetical protein